MVVVVGVVVVVVAVQQAGTALQVSGHTDEIAGMLQLLESTEQGTPLKDKSTHLSQGAVVVLVGVVGVVEVVVVVGVVVAGWVVEVVVVVVVVVVVGVVVVVVAVQQAGTALQVSGHTDEIA